MLVIWEPVPAKES
ncbi:unnamed protein product [Gulo gulo]|uniref:Uncharacterized protein n=1 Tax=Gulo gulo TaxID=48420 RepID=A0A9X9LW18_GULGU|nr:unnamed protein product [Gulo gulo]